MTLQSERAAVIAAAQSAMLDVLRTHPTASADDIRPHVIIPPHVHPSIIGNAIQGLRRDGVIVPESIIATSRPVGHSHLMRRWQLAEPPIGQSSPSAGWEVSR